MSPSMRIALAAMALSLPAPALAAASAAPSLETPIAVPVPAESFALDTVMIVQDWILCVSGASALRIAEARAESADAARRVYDELAAQKACGQFKKLGVMLHEPLYRSAPTLNVDTRVFGAQVNIGVGWQSGFVVAGGLAE